MIVILIIIVLFILYLLLDSDELNNNYDYVNVDNIKFNNLMYDIDFSNTISAINLLPQRRTKIIENNKSRDFHNNNSHVSNDIDKTYVLNKTNDIINKINNNTGKFNFNNITYEGQEGGWEDRNEALGLARNLYKPKSNITKVKLYKNNNIYGISKPIKKINTNGDEMIIYTILVTKNNVKIMLLNITLINNKLNDIYVKGIAKNIKLTKFENKNKNKNCDYLVNVDDFLEEKCEKKIKDEHYFINNLNKYDKENAIKYHNSILNL